MRTEIHFKVAVTHKVYQLDAYEVTRETDSTSTVLTVGDTFCGRGIVGHLTCCTDRYWSVAPVDIVRSLGSSGLRRPRVSIAKTG
jgi:hypothetical protein